MGFNPKASQPSSCALPEHCLVLYSLRPPIIVYCTIELTTFWIRIKKFYWSWRNRLCFDRNVFYDNGKMPRWRTSSLEMNYISETFCSYQISLSFHQKWAVIPGGNGIRDPTVQQCLMYSYSIDIWWYCWKWTRWDEMWHPQQSAATYSQTTWPEHAAQVFLMMNGQAFQRGDEWIIRGGEEYAVSK